MHLPLAMRAPALGSGGVDGGGVCEAGHDRHGMIGPRQHCEAGHRRGIVAMAVVAVMLVCFPHYAASSGHAAPLPPGRCLDYGVDDVVRYTCSAPATVAFCIFSYTMNPHTGETEERLARELVCRPSQFMNDPCYLNGPGACDHARAHARVRGIATMDTVWRACEGIGDVPRYEGRGEFSCPATARSADPLDEIVSSTGDAVGGGDDTGFSRDDVLRAQKVLAALGYDPGPPDGRWGPRTGKAVQSFLDDARLSLVDLLTMQARRAVRRVREAASSGRDDDTRALQEFAGAGTSEKICEGRGDGARPDGRATSGCNATAQSERSPSPQRMDRSVRGSVDREDDNRSSAGDVLEAQRVLARLGFDPGPADGQWGPRTGKAVQAFLGDAGLSITDILTRQALRAVRKAASSDHADETPELAQPSRALRSGAPREPGAVHERSAAARVSEPQCADMRRPSGCWMEFENISGCYMWLEKVGPEVTVLSAKWYGRCSEGKATGPGNRMVKVRFRIDDASFEGEGLEEGSFVSGKAHGRWVNLDDDNAMRTSTDYVDGEVQRIEVRNTETGGCVISNFDRGTFLNSHDC